MTNHQQKRESMKKTDYFGIAFLVLLALLVDRQYDEFEKVYGLNRAIGLPTSLEEIEISEEQWEECMERIPEMSDVAHYPYKVTREMLEEAMEKLKEREGKANEE